MGQMDWINRDKLASFILKCQDDEDGGIADRPDDAVDVFHTFFGIAGLSLLGHLHREGSFPTYRWIDPVYAMPTDVVVRLKLSAQVVARTNQVLDDRLAQYKVYHYDE